MNKRDKIIDKVKGLLALAESSRNSNDNEAQAAMLKAQELMAKYNITIEETESSQDEGIICAMPEHKWDYAYRVPLALVISENFRCKVFSRGKRMVFLGRSTDVQICKNVFEFAYKYIMRRGNQEYNKRYSLGLRTKGIFNDYAQGFIAGLKNAFDIQCRALLIVVPQDVEHKFSEMSKNWDTKATQVKSSGNRAVFNQGYMDGQNFVQKDNLIQ